jgi:UDP-glucuronate decarboxylase
MKILITGVAGFLGSNLATRLIQDGHSIVGIDDFSTGSPRNLVNLKISKDFEFFCQDVRNPLNFDVDAILNFACPASPVHYQSDPVRTIETNFLGMVNVLHLAQKLGCKVLQASTSEVYGDPLITPQTEEYWGNVNPIGIRSCYDEGKRAAETLCFDYRRQYNTDIRVVRIFNTFGPGMAVGDGRVVSNFIVQALTNKPITIYGSGNQTRSFCYVSDLVDGIVKTLELSDEIDKPINLGNPTEHTMMELADMVVELTGSNSKVEFKQLPLDDPQQRRPDISRAKSLLNWEPQIEISKGITETISYFRNLIEA